MPAEPVKFRFRADRYGFRNDIDRASAEVVLLGDSMIVGALVPSDKTISAVLEQITGRSTMQAALIGIAPQEAQDMLDEARVPLKGAHVIQFIFEGNDLLDSRRYRAEKGKPRPRETRSLMLNEIWFLLARMTDKRSEQLRRRICTINGQTYTFLWDRTSFADLSEGMSAIEESLAKFAARVRALGARYSVVFVPDKLRVLAKYCAFEEHSEIKDPADHIGPVRADLLDWGRKSGIGVLVLTPELVRAADDGRIPWFWGDTHWNEEGHLAAAEAIAAWLGQRGEPGAIAPSTLRSGQQP